MLPATKRALLAVTAASVLAVGLAFAFWPQAVPVDLAAVDRGPLSVTVEEEGKTQVREVYVVSAPIAGRLLRVERHAGDAVFAGETVLATLVPSQPSFLDPRTQAEMEAAAKAAEAARDLAAAERDEAEAAVAFADAEHERAAALDVRGNISKSALDRALFEARTRRAALERAKAALTMRAFELETARARLISPQGNGGAAGGGCCVEVRSPVSGRVLRVINESEGNIAAGTPLIEVGDPADLEILVELLSEDALRIREAAPAMLDAGAGLTFAGRVRRIEPHGHTKVSALGIEEQRVNTLIDPAAALSELGRLGHGYRVQARIEVSRAEDVVRVPIGALFRARASWAVFTADRGRARLLPVTIGPRNTSHAVVVEGLAPGDLVVLHPSDRVGDGVRIEPRPVP